MQICIRFFPSPPLSGLQHSQPPHLRQKGWGWIIKHLPALIFLDSRIPAKENKPEPKILPPTPLITFANTTASNLMPEPSLPSQVKPCPSCSHSTSVQQAPSPCSEASRASPRGQSRVLREAGRTSHARAPNDLLYNVTQAKMNCPP